MNLIYMDNAATSFPKPKCVVDAVVECMTGYCANPGRGSHSMSVKSGSVVMDARCKAAAFFNAENPMNVIFTTNATHAINYALKGILKSGQHVITTSMEHNSVIRPLRTMEIKMGIEVDIIRCGDRGIFDPEDIRNAIKTNTALVVCTYSSNVTGTIMPVRDIGRIAKENGILFLLDASQGAGSCEVDMKDIGADFVAFPGHKGMMGPQGTGGLIISERNLKDTIIEGGTGSDSANINQPDVIPDRFESGTPNVPGIAGLKAAIEYINGIGLRKIKNHRHEMLRRLTDGVKQIRGAALYSSENVAENSGIVALNIRDMDSTEVSYLLDTKFNIATRAGIHCSPEAHRTLGTLERGIVRISPGWFNTYDDAERTLDALERIAAERCV